MKWSKRDILFAGLLSLILLTIAGGIAYISYKFKDYEFALSEVAKTKQVPGPKGDAGITTIQTITSYLPGKDGQSATDEQVATAVNNYFAAHPVHDGKDGAKGDKGDTGDSGRVVYVNLLDMTCRFQGNDEWQPIEECAQ